MVETAAVLPLRQHRATILSYLVLPVQELTVTARSKLRILQEISVVP